MKTKLLTLTCLWAVVLAKGGESITVRDRIVNDLSQEIAGRLNVMPPVDWFTKHNGDAEFGTVSSFMVTLSALQDHCTNAWYVFSTEGSTDRKELEDLVVVSGVARLYDEDRSAGIWVARFWREKGLAANSLYLENLRDRAVKDSSSRELSPEEQKAVVNKIGEVVPNH
jgi:hypothetical protein